MPLTLSQNTAMTESASAERQLQLPISVWCHGLDLIGQSSLAKHSSIAAASLPSTDLSHACQELDVTLGGLLAFTDNSVSYSQSSQDTPSASPNSCESASLCFPWLFKFLGVEMGMHVMLTTPHPCL